MTITYCKTNIMDESLRCIMRRDSFKLNNNHKMYISIIFMFLGWASEKANRLFVKNFKHHDKRNAPIEHIMILIWKVYLHVTPDWSIED